MWHFVSLHQPFFISATSSSSPSHSKDQWSYRAINIHAVPAFCFASSFWTILTPPPLPSLRCPSEKQPALSALHTSGPDMDSNAPGSSGALSFLVRPQCHPHFHGGSHQSSAPSTPLTACLFWPYPIPKGPRGVKSAGSSEFIRLSYLFLLRSGCLICTVLSDIQIVLYISVHCVERFV